MANKRLDRILGARFEADGELVWIETPDQPRSAFDSDYGEPYPSWLLVERKTDWVLARIDGPDKDELCYAVEPNGGSRRQFISFDGARRYARASALSILVKQRAESAQRRHSRRQARIKSEA